MKTVSRMERTSVESAACACGTVNPLARVRCRGCGRSLGPASDPTRGIEAALEGQHARVLRLASQAQGAAAAAEARLRQVSAAGAREASEAATRARQAIETDVGHRFEHELEALSALLAPIRDEPALAGWEASVWQRTPALARPPSLVRIGSARAAAPTGAAAVGTTLPILTPAIGAGHLVVRADAARRDEALGLISAVLLRTLASLPSGDIRFRIHDPVGLGASLGEFGAFDAPRIAHGLATTDAGELRQALHDLIAHANAISARYLRGAHASLTDFLATTGHGLAQYEVLVLLDYPATVGDDSAEQLTRLASHGASRGIMLLVHQATDAAGNVLADLPGAVTVHGDPHGGWRSSLLPGVAFVLDPPPPAHLVETVAARTTPPPTPLLFEEVSGGAEPWSASSGEGLTAPLGRDGQRAVELRLDDDTPHGLVAGDTGSGKSNLLRVAIYGLARRYAPAELQLYLLDFKEGVEFREFAPAAGDPTFLPHARVVSTNSSRAFGVAVLEHLAELTAQRFAALRDSAKSLAALRAREPDRELPRVVLVIDEFHVLFERTDALSGRAIAALTLIAKQGRAAGIHFLLATQAIGDVGVGNANAARLDGVFNAARLRIALRLGERESQTILRTGNRAASDLHERGIAIVNARQGDEDGNLRTKVAFLDDAAAARERRAAVSRAVGARRPPRVFDGATGADAGANQALRMALHGRTDTPQRTWIGAELALDPEDPRGHPPVAVDLVPDAHRHLAVVGAGARSALSVLQWSSVGLGASDRSTAFTFVDLLREADAVPSGAVAATAEVLRGMGCSVELSNERSARALTALLDAGAGPRRAVVVLGFDRLIGLDEPLDPDAVSSFAETPRSVLAESLGRAGASGTHLLGWWSTFDALEHAFGMQQHLLGIRAYLEVPDQRLLMATGGESDEASEWPLAILHDQALGRAPRELHLFEPFGRAAVPGFLRVSA